MDIDFANRNDDIQVLIEGNLPQISLDVTRMRLLLRNLIDNALRYNPPGTRPVVVSAKFVDGQLLIRVQDHGAGIAPEHINRVTEPFYRADPARSRATGGVGLGLYLCKRVAEVHGGSLAIDSSAGAGTGVTVILPLAGNS